MLNLFEHAINYNCIEELENATAEIIQVSEVACANGTLKLIPLGLAFDNLDEINLTLSRAVTLHDPIGTLNQNFPSNDELCVSCECTS